MRLVTIKLEPLHIVEGIVIASDVMDSLGRLLMKAPKTLDEKTKEILLSRGVREVIIQDRRETTRVEDARAIEEELEALERRLALLSGNLMGQEIKVLVQKTVSQYYEQKLVRP